MVVAVKLIPGTMAPRLMLERSWSETEEGPFRSHYLYRERGTQNSSREMVVPIGGRKLALTYRTVPQPIIERQMRN